jgi:glycosyltransferase involved in cell wall biosynthesis
MNQSKTAFKRAKDWLHLTLLYWQRVWLEFWRWRGVRRNGFTKLSVYYSHDHVPRRDEKAGGGMIKCQDLSDRFPNTPRAPNLLYMINSVMPIHAPVMVHAAKRAGAIFVLNQNGVAYEGWHGPGWEKTNAPMKVLIENAEFVFYQSAFCKMGADKFLGHCRAPWMILHNPVDTTRFVPTLKKPAGARLLLAGSHHHWYRVRTALEMMPALLTKIPEATLTVAGRYFWKPNQADCISESTALVQSLGIQNAVEIRGAYSQDEAIGLFQEHHVLLHTKYNDPCPRLVVEGMSCGLPVVYSASGGVPELVGPEGGEGVEMPLDWTKDHPADPDLLAAAAEKVLANLPVYARAARERAVKHLDVRHWLDEHERVFMELLKKRQL